MPDPLGLLGSTGGIQPMGPHSAGASSRKSDDGEFRKLLEEQIRDVNTLQQDARKAVEDLTTGRRDDLEGVILATQKAETAFKMLLAVRNKVMDAYEEVKQIRV
jgi:flagellar hook-basal body complex protein FliE